MLGLQFVERQAGADLDAAARRGADLHGQVGQADERPRGQDGAALDGVAQLADVARPGVAPQRGAGLVGEAGQHLVRRAREERQQVVGQRQHVARPLTQRRQHHLDHVQPIEQILAEAPCRDLGRQVAVRRRHHAHVAGPGPRLADALVALLLKQAQQLRLQGRRQVADLVEEQRAPLGRRHPADRVAHRPGEGTADVAEQFALQQLRRQARTVDRDERPGSARAAGVNGPRQHALAGPALAPQQHGRLTGRRLEGEVERLPLHRLLRLQVGLGHHRAHLVFQLVHPRRQPPHFHRAVQCHAQPVGRERLGQVVEGAAPHRLDGGLDGSVRGDDDDVQPGCQPQQFRQQVEPLLARQPQVEEGDVEQAVAEQLQCLRGIDRLGGVVAHRLKRQPQRPAHAGVIVDDQEVHGSLAVGRPGRA